MEVIHDISYGIIPLHQTNEAVRVLLIHQRSHRGDQFWTFPKGHQEPGESNETAARRELREETGITEITLDTQKRFVTEYIFVHEGKKVHKRVEFFIGFVSDITTKITQPQEIVALEWCDMATAATRLSHQNTRTLLSEVENYLQLL